MTSIDWTIIGLLAWTSSIQFAWLSPALVMWQRRIKWRAYEQQAITVPAGIPLIRPVRGHKPDLARALASSQTLLAKYHCHLVCVLDAQDEALDLCEQTVAQLRAQGLQASICTTRNLPPGNHKANQLVAAQQWLAAHNQAHAMELYCDADVDVSTVALGAMVQALQDQPQCAAVWLPFRDHTQANPLASVSAGVLQESMQSFAYLGYLSKATCVGKILLLRQQALQAVGGWQACNHSVGEDMLLGRHLTSKGYAIWMAPSFACCWRSGESEQVFVQRLRRWLLALREQSLWMLLSYPLLLATWPLLLCLHAFAMAIAVRNAPGYSLWLLLSACILCCTRYQLGRLIAGQLASVPITMAQRIWLQWRADWQLLQTAWWACWHRTIVWAGQEVAIETEPQTTQPPSEQDPS